MKKNGYRIISALGIILAIGGLAWGVYSMTHLDLKFNSGFASQFKGEPINVPVKSGNDFSIDGIWDLSVIQGPPSLKVFATPSDFSKLEIINDGERISLSMGKRGMGFGKGIRAELSMPDLGSLSTQGGAHIDIYKLKTGSFHLKTEGASSITIRESQITDLNLVSEGASSIEAGTSKITNALVNLDGAFNAVLGMNGGTLGGQIKGLGHLSYLGIVSAQTIKTDDLASVDHK